MVANLAFLGAVSDEWNWIGLIATLVGLLISVIGLSATYLQARGAKSAAIAAAEAAKDATSRLQTRILESSLSSTQVQIQLIKQFVSVNNLDGARASFHVCSRDIRDLFHNLKLSPLVDSGNPSSDLNIVLKEISAALDGQSLPTAKKANILQSLRMLSARLSDEEIKGSGYSHEL